MARRPNVKTAEKEIAHVIRWAERQGFKDIADTLRRVLALLADRG